MASEKGDHDVVQTMLGAGADVNIARSYVSDVHVISKYINMYSPAYCFTYGTFYTKMGLVDLIT